MQAQSSNPAPYVVNTEDDIIVQAFEILSKRLPLREVMISPKAVKDYLIMANAVKTDQAVERFSVLFLDSNHGVICFETMFSGTLNQTSVYPREIVRAALKHNASAVILSHNHPSGNPEPSSADEKLTQILKDALRTVDVRVLDHIVVTPSGKSISFAERGMI